MFLILSRLFERSCCVQIAKKHYVEILSSLPPSSVSKLREFNYTFLVGISHSKSRNRMPSSQGDRYNYLSRLYAFSVEEPYDMIARSGLFCFGFPDVKKDTIGHDVGVGNDYNNLTKVKKLELNRKTYNCPNIHFVDSMIDKAGDESRIVVSLGVNDCVPRFIELSKRDVVIHLFSS